MKKLILVSLFIFGLCSNANAKSGPYLGFDINTTKATHRYLHENGNKMNNDNSFGYSISAGYNFDLNNKFFLAPEIFYDKLGSSNNSYLCPSGGLHYCKDKVEVNSRYGAKLNLGYEIAPKTKVFINGGYANVNMDQKYFNGYTEITSGKVFVRSNKNGVFTYGLGASYDIHKNLALRASYEISKFRVVHQDFLLPNPLDKVTLQILKFGVVYSF